MKLSSTRQKKLVGVVFSLAYIHVSLAQETVTDAVKDAVNRTPLGITLPQGIYLGLTVVFSLTIYYSAKYLLDRQIKGETDKVLIRSIILFVIALVGIIAVILALPMGDSLRGQITSLIGIVLAAALSLSSATFLGNAMAGIQNSMIKSFNLGDFVQVNDIFGRVSEKGLFHTEIQTIDRDLITVPNLFLSNNPVKVTRSSGTFISAECSLGYDVSRIKIEECLIAAATRAGLADAFVHVTSLGDFSVVYKVHGMLQDIKTVLSARSRLHSCILDTLHEANIEIMSPNFVNQRQIVGTPPAIPEKPKKEEIEKAKELDNVIAENMIFDKAEEAESIEQRKEHISKIVIKIKDLEAAHKAAITLEEKKDLVMKKEKWINIKEKMLVSIDEKIDEINKTV